MRILLVTVAGMSRRFSESLGRECLKCIYYKKDVTESLLYRILHQEMEFDRYIIVGGFRFEELKEQLHAYYSDLLPKIRLIENVRYQEYGSGYSFYLGLKEAVRLKFKELIFSEGDLFFDRRGFERLYHTTKDAVTCSPERICADKSVAFYFDMESRLHYIYDTRHKAFLIREPFTGIFHSGQVWKFCNRPLAEQIMQNMDAEKMQGTNLAFIEEYFQSIPKKQYDIVEFQEWINCNTVDDFYKIAKIETGDRNERRWKYGCFG